MRLWFLSLLILVPIFPLRAQIGYPGGYPGGRGGMGIPGIPGIPRPGRGQKKTPKESETPAATFNGKLRKLDGKSIVVETADSRILEFERLRKTVFYRRTQQIDASDFKSGDRVSVEATRDDQGYLHALTVRFDETPEAPAAAKSEPAQPATEDEEPAPVLRRRSPEAPAAAPPAPATAPAAAPEPEEPRVAENRPAPGAEVVERIDDGPPPDPFIEKAREAAESMSETLPNYVCTEMMSRFLTNTPTPSWRPLDIVSAEVVYEDGKESYRNVAINGKPVKKRMEEIGGSWSTGEFGTELRDLLSPATAARFHRREETTLDGHTAIVFDFEVGRENSHWSIGVPSQSLTPAYRGSVFIEKATGRVLRIESEARKIPSDFPLDKVESNVDYQYVRFGEAQFLLPVHAENLSCQRGARICTRNTIDFRNCHKYTSDTQVTFEPAK